MEIKTKFNIGDIAYYIDGGEIKKFVVDLIKINCTSEKTTVHYEDGDEYWSREESELFANRQETLAFINKQFDEHENGEG
jgi:hypothetical protein